MDFLSSEGNEAALSSTEALVTALENANDKTIRSIATNDTVVEALIENKEETQELINAIRENSEVNSALRQETARSWLSDTNQYSKIQD
jgi:hypothetical protein